MSEIFESRISSSLDDVEERSTGRIYTDSSDLEMADDGANTGQTIGLRFTSIDIPDGATITSAYIQFQVDEVDTGLAALTIQGENTNDAAPFTTARFDVSSRARTAASVTWEPAAWTSVGAAGAAQQTADLTAIVQEIIDRGDWSPFNDLGFIITGSGVRTAESFDGTAAGAPLLRINYAAPDSNSASPVLDLDADDSTAPGSGYAAQFSEGGAPVPIADLDVSITDSDDTDMERATITLTNAQSGDMLTVNEAALPPGIILGPASTATSVVLFGTASIADYEAALQQVSFTNSTTTPPTADRVIDVVVNDGSGNSNTATATISIDVAPAAANDSAVAQANTTTTTGNVLANDDPGNAPASIVAYDTTGTAGGTVLHNGDGTFDYTPVADFTGTDSFTYTIEDADGDQSSATVTLNVFDTGGGPPSMIERRIAASADDVEERSTGRVYTDSSDLEMADDGANTGQTIGLRFTNIDIPDGATITSAYIQFQVDEVDSGLAALTIQGENTSDAAPFTTARFDVSSRARTAASVTWEPAAWTAVGAAGMAQQTADLTAIVQEIIDRGDWSPFNDLGFIITGSGVRTAESFDGTAAGAPLLRINYAAPDSNSVPPVLDLDADDSTAPGSGYAAQFSEGGGPVSIADADVSISDSDDTDMERATISLTNAQTGDMLTVNEAALPPGIILGPASTATSVVLFGTASLADYESALQQVSFTNSSTNPPTADRTIDVVVNDGSGNSNTATASISIDVAPAAANDSAVAQANTTTTTGNVLANDDPGNAPASIVAYDTTGTAGGAVLHNGDGTFDYTPATDFTGTDSFTYTIEDADGDQSSATVTLNVFDTGGGPPSMIERRIVASADDVEERSTGRIYTDSSDLEMADDGANTGQTIGLRFTNIDIPDGATITSAYIQFQVDEVDTGLAALTIQGENTSDAAPFTTARFDVSSRARTAASVTWEPAAWTAVGAAGMAQQTADLTAIVQEIIDRGDWSPFNDLGFIITGSGVRTAESFDGTAAGAPLLRINYAAPDSNSAPPVLDLDADDSSAPGSGYAAQFSEGGAPVAIADADVSITDSDDTDMERATITLANAQTGDALTVNEAALPPGIILGPASTATSVVLFGTASLSDYEAALQQVSFTNNSTTPPTADRVIDVVVNDGSGNSNTATATISIDVAPAAANDSAVAQANTTTTTGNVLANDDPGNAPANIVAYDTTGTAGGTVLHNGDGTFDYTPVTDFTGTDSFTYTIEDADGDQSSATVTLNVTLDGSGDAPSVVGIHTMWSHDIPDPSGIAYDRTLNRILISDSEVDELSVYNGSNLFAFTLSPGGLDGAPSATYNFPFTPEPTGLAIDNNLNRMYITDDDEEAVFVVNPTAPTALLWSFDLSVLGSDDAEDVAVDPDTGNIFIINGLSRSIQELAIDHATQTATLVSNISLSDPAISDPEAIAYDPDHNVFLIGGGFGPNIFVVDRSGGTLNTVELLQDYRNDHVPGGSGTVRTSVKDIELAPASATGSGMHIYVADFGDSHVNDGRLIEIDPGDIFVPQLPELFFVDDLLI